MTNTGAFEIRPPRGAKWRSWAFFLLFATLTPHFVLTAKFAFPQATKGQEEQVDDGREEIRKFIHQLSTPIR